MIELKTVIPILKEKYSFYQTLYNDVIGLKKKDDDGDDDDDENEKAIITKLNRDKSSNYKKKNDDDDIAAAADDDNNDNNRLYHCDNNHLWITKDDNIRMKQKLSPKILEKTLLIEDMLRTSMIFKKIMQLHNNQQLDDDDDDDNNNDDDDDKSHIDIDNQIQDKVNLNYDDDLIKSIQFNNNLIMIIKQIWKIYLSNLNQKHTNNDKKNRYEMIMINYKNIFDVINSSSDNDSGSIDDCNDDDDDEYSDMVMMKNWKNLSKKEAQKTLSADEFKKWKKIMKQQKRKNNNDSDDDDNDD
jgi:hypothetical protein